MKKILLLITILVSTYSIAQYDSEVNKLKKLCNTEINDISDLFDSEAYNHIESDSLITFHNTIHESFYIVDYSQGNIVSSYIEPYDKLNLKMMRQTIKKIAKHHKSVRNSKIYSSEDYFYVVSSFRNVDNTILISITKKKWNHIN